LSALQEYGYWEWRFGLKGMECPNSSETALIDVGLCAAKVSGLYGSTADRLAGKNEEVP
jgi:hypothetical protein